MPGIDFARLRQQISLAQVLDLLGFTATTRRGPQVRGPCPVHDSASPRSRSFAAHVDKSCWRCFGCGAGGNALDLYLAVTRLPVYEGALELCARLGVAPPRRADIPVRHCSYCGAGRQECLPSAPRSPPP